MNKTGCIHPELLSALARCGHGDQILIADGNYPLQAKCPQAQRIYLGLTAGVPTVTEVLKTLLSEIAVEKAEVMLPEDGSEPAIFGEFRTLLSDMPLEGLGRWEFYEAAARPAVQLAIATGEQRTFANILLTVGCA